MKGVSKSDSYAYGPGDGLTRIGLGSVRPTYTTPAGHPDSDNTFLTMGAAIGFELGGINGAIEGGLLGSILDD